MRKLVLFALASLVSGSIAMAQTKIDTKWHCAKASTEHKLDIGDAPDHIYWIGQGSCEATASEGGLKEKVDSTPSSTTSGKPRSTSTVTTMLRRRVGTRFITPMRDQARPTFPNPPRISGRLLAAREN